MAVRGGWRPLSALMCEIVNSVGRGNCSFVREKSGNFKNLNGCGNPDMETHQHCGVCLMSGDILKLV